jgi:hypothetical protein
MSQGQVQSGLLKGLVQWVVVFRNKKQGLKCFVFGGQME